MFRKITRGNLDLFLKNYATESRVLDVGSGGSSYGRFFPNRLTVDIDPDRKPDIVADAEHLPFEDGEFELILCTEVLEHVKNPFNVEKELYRVLKPGGRLILTTRFVYPIHDSPHDYWRYTKYGLKELFKNWKFIELKEESENFSAIAILLQRIAFQSTLRFNSFLKFVIFILAWIINKLNFLTVREYGDIKKQTIEKNIFTTGYYIVVEK